MVQQMQSQCDDCGGSGDFIREKDRCKKCKGKRLLERDHKLEVGVYLLYGAFYILCVKHVCSWTYCWRGGSLYCH